MLSIDLSTFFFFPGILSCSITLFFIASPLSMLFHVIRVKNTECLPFPIILSSFFVSLLWYFYGILIDDGFLQVIWNESDDQNFIVKYAFYFCQFPNLVGCILASLQLLLFVKYPSRSGGNGPGYQQLDTAPIF
jgi:solute carrier family 50 (sugar transporter)